MIAAQLGRYIPLRPAREMHRISLAPSHQSSASPPRALPSPRHQWGSCPRPWTAALRVDQRQCFGRRRWRGVSRSWALGVARPLRSGGGHMRMHKGPDVRSSWRGFRMHQKTSRELAADATALATSARKNWWEKPSTVKFLTFRWSVPVRSLHLLLMPSCP